MLDLLEGTEEEELTLEMINLWEDTLPRLLSLPMKIIPVPDNIPVYEYDFYSVLAEIGYPKTIFYPIMRINGFKSSSEVTISTKSIIIPEGINLVELRDELLKFHEI